MGFKVILSSESAFQAIVWMNAQECGEILDICLPRDYNYKYGGSVPDEEFKHIFVFENRNLAMRVKLMFGGKCSTTW